MAAQILIGGGANKIPIKKIGQQALDTYIGRGTSAVKDGYFDNRAAEVEEAGKLDLKIDVRK